ncbi:SDR family NAD(P)-dependent oxidoreductase [Jiangella alba]|uniref:NAD(P)-dependent dehydrogenase, short-chain alcohol dehydrogenase family n=1 Tax=Jiangella alba TaxID=561176 RepID=A0A1H5PQM6_9ACTN|nr:SDR family oxidoreductase [Jiangella alba]SEF16029.1 NAD(P)-dependent dehydrogenase, short-chain alcohol dehydrogenase family [Jiangella alba]
MRVAIVTGASSGIGRSTAIQLAARGAGVVLTYHRNEAGALDTVARIEKDGGAAVALPLDLSDAATFPAFRAAVTAVLRERWQRDTVDVLVNNGGFAESAPFAEMTEERFDRLYRGLFKGPYFLTQTLLPVLADGAAVVNVTSSSALAAAPEAGYSGYAAMKGGLAVATRFLAKELGPRGIRVNAVAPGPTRTRLGDDAIERFPELVAPLAAKTALGRIGEPGDVGTVIAMLAGDEGRWITAQQIEVSGGYGL